MGWNYFQPYIFYYRKIDKKSNKKVRKTDDHCRKTTMQKREREKLKSNRGGGITC